MMGATAVGPLRAAELQELAALRREVETLRARLAFFERTHLPPLTEAQLRVLRFLREFIRVREFAPSHEEIAEHMGYQSLATVHEKLSQLERKGYIRRRYNEARSITLSPAARP